MRALAADDHPRPGRPAAEVELVGDLDDLSVIALGSVGRQRRHPRVGAGGEDLLAQGLGQLQADRELDARGAAVIEELVRGAGTIATDHDLRVGADLAREGLQRVVEHGDVVGGGVRAGVARP